MISAEGIAGSAVLALSDGASAPTSALNEGRFRYNPGANQLEYSQNGGAWTAFGAGATSPWTNVAGTVYPNNTTDDVVIGATSMSGGGEKFRVVGDELLEGDLVFGSGSPALITWPKAAAASLGGSIRVWSGEGGDAATGVAGGYVNVFGGKGGTGTAGDGGPGGDARLEAGDGGSGTGNQGLGGNVYVIAGTGDGGGDVEIRAGTSFSSVGGDTYLLAGQGSTSNGVVSIASSYTVDCYIGAASNASSPCFVTCNYGVLIRDAVNLQSFFEMEDGRNAAATTGNTGRLRYNGSLNYWEYSENGGPWTQCFGASGASPWTSSGGVVYPTTIGDDVSVGVSSMAGTERFRVYGSVSIGNGGSLSFESLGDVTTPKGTSSVGFAIRIYPGDGEDSSFSTGGTGGFFIAESGDGGDVVVGGGDGGDGGDAQVIGGTGGQGLGGSSFSGGSGGPLVMEGGIGGRNTSAGDDVSGGPGGDVNIAGGRGGATSSGNGGSGGIVTVIGGRAIGGQIAGNAGSVTVQGGEAAISSAAADKKAGLVTLQGGVGPLGSSSDGGDVVVNGGDAQGTGADGDVLLGTSTTNVVQFGNGSVAPTVRLDGTGQKLELADDGYIGIDERTTDPSAGASEGVIYSKDDSGVTQLFYRASDGTIYQLTPTGSGGAAQSVESSVYSCPSGVSVGDAVQITTADNVDLADASVPADRPVIGFVKSKPTSTTCVLHYYGELGGFTGLTVGATYYLSESTPGAITTTAPSTVGSIVQEVGFARSSTTLVVFIDPDFTQL